MLTQSPTPPLGVLKVTTDAAGWAKGSSCSSVGAGGICLDLDGKIGFACQTLWTCQSNTLLIDGKGKFLGSKTTTLELAGMLIPFLLFPEVLSGHHVILEVDNMGGVFGWNNGFCKEDNMASIMIRCLVLLSAKLEIALHVQHLPRLSSWEACLADRLSRLSTTSMADRALLSSFSAKPLPTAFAEWLAHPSEDWSLPLKLV